MAAQILHHPIFTTAPGYIAPDTFSTEELLLILECESPFLMPMARLQNLIEGTVANGSAGQIRAYLVGIFDMRKMIRAVRPDLVTS